MELVGDVLELVVVLAHVIRFDWDSVRKVQSVRVDEVIDDDGVVLVVVREHVQVLDEEI